MTPALELHRVSKAYERGRQRIVALREASLTIEAGEFVGVYGARHSGRSTLLRVAAGVDEPDSGTVLAWPHGADGRPTRPDAPEVVLADPSMLAVPGRAVVEHVALPLLATGLSFDAARARATDALADVGVDVGAADTVADLDAEALLRVALARSLAPRPTVLLLDEPTIGLDDVARDRTLLLLRSIARSGTSVVITAGSVADIAGVERALTVADGELSRRSSRRGATVFDLSCRTRSGKR